MVGKGCFTRVRYHAYTKGKDQTYLIILKRFTFNRQSVLLLVIFRLLSKFFNQCVSLRFFHSRPQRCFLLSHDFGRIAKVLFRLVVIV
jgi:hypothetical protein